MELKQCTKCHEFLTLDKFGKKSKAKDGLIPSCKECEKIHSKIYYDENKETLKEKSLLYYNENREERIVKLREYYNINHDEIREYQKQAKINNPEHFQQIAQNSRDRNKVHKALSDKLYRSNNVDALKIKRAVYRKTDSSKLSQIKGNKKYRQTPKGKLNSIMRTEKRRVLKLSLPYNYSIEEWNNCLTYFNGECAYCGSKIRISQDHYIALSKGGEYTKNNIIPACMSCNSGKCDNNPFTWYKSKPFYTIKRENKILKYLHYKNQIQQLSISI